MKSPQAERRPRTVRKHGDTRRDPYWWLREREDPKVIKHLEAENAYTAQRMKGTRTLQKKLYGEIRSRIKETDLELPVIIDDYSYYVRTVRGKQYAIHCRRQADGKGRESILLDENREAKGHDFFSLGVFRVSPNHRLLAYSVDTRGNERYTLRIRDLGSGRNRRDVLKNVDSIAWSADSQTLFYTVLDEAHRPFQVYRHTLGQVQKKDVLIHHEKDDAFYTSVSLSRSRDFILIHLHAKTTSEVRYIPADQPERRAKIVQRRKSGVEYSIDHGGTDFFITHNARATNFKVGRIAIGALGKGRTKSLIPHRKSVLVDGIDVFQDHLVVYEREAGLPHIAIYDHGGKFSHRIPFREAAYDVDADRNPLFATHKLRFSYTSLITPRSVYEYDVRTRKRTLLKQTPVLGYTPTRYKSDRIWARAADGTEIPISLVHRKGMRRSGRNPLLLTGYGSYGLNRDPVFSSTRLSLIDRGVIFAIAHIRGGSEMGRPWYTNGKFLHKKNTFNDFIACAEALIDKRYTSPAKLAINGGSAGGLLMGAVLNMRPKLFGVALAAVPFVDVLNTMLDPTLPLTITEYDEWGNPNQKRYYDYMKSYAPYENVCEQEYPRMLVTAGLNDPRVGYWEPAKWVARLREMKIDDNELLLKTEMGSGHFGASGRYNMFKDIAFEYAYLLTRLGVEPGMP